MTTASSEQKSVTVPSISANAPVASSYASAADAVKKPVPTPVVATRSSASVPQHAKSSSNTPLNGRPSIMPAVPSVPAATPAVAHGTSSANGEAHSRKPSVTLSNGPSGASAPKNIQFGFQDSPAASHSSPQPGSAPIAIPGGNPRVTSPQNSPSPIPQPSATGGGRPPSGAGPGNAMTFGSFGGDGDRPHMRTGSASQDPNTLASHASPHMRRSSSHSHNDMSAQQIPPQPGMGRGGFPGAGRGRGNFNNYNQPNMGYPPGPNFGRGGAPNQGRGGMPPNFNPNARQQPPFGTPPQAHRSPAMNPAMPHQQPPNVAPNNMPGFYYPPPPMGPTQVPQVMLPPPFSQSTRPARGGRKKTPKRGYGRSSHGDDSAICQQASSADYGAKSNKRWRVPSHLDGPPEGAVLHHENIQGVLERHPHALTSAQSPFLPYPNKNYYQGPSYYDPNMRGTMQMGGYPGYPMMHGQGSPAPAFQQPYGQGPYNPPGGQPMSRQGSQVSTHEHRPASSASQGPPPSQGTPQMHHAQMKPAIVSSPQQFTRPPKKSAALIIKNPQGETVDLAHLKAPASPAPITQQSKTPPVVASTPPPPSAASNPPAHTRTESSGTTKTAEEVRNEFKEKMKQAAMAEKAKDEEAAKAKEAEAAEKAAAEEKAKADEAARIAEEEKAKAEAAKKEEADAAAAAAAKETAKPAETEEEELDRIIREMEEADAKREAEAAEREAKRKIEIEEKKKKDEENRKANAAANDQKLRDAEAEMERLEEEREAKRRAQGDADVHALLKSASTDKPSEATTDEAADKLAKLSIDDKSTPAAGAKSGPGGRGNKPAALNLAPLKTNSIEPPQPSAALQSLKTARLLDTIKTDIYPAGIQSPNPALNAAVSRKGTSFKYDPSFLLQFKSVFTEQPSLDFNQQVKTLIGDGDGGRSASARTPAGTGRQPSKGGLGFPMGTFTQPTRTLPPGTTSEQRMAMSSGALARPPVPGPMQSFQRPGGAFPSSMSSRSGSGSMGSHSARQGSKSGRNSSKPHVNHKQEVQAAKTMPLTAGMKIEALNTSTTGWKPMSIGKASASGAGAGKDGELMDPAMVQRKVKAALNKMTPENFDKISDQILTIAAQSKDETDGRTLRQVIQLTFEKATDEAHWASMYAKFCKRMLETMNPDIRDENIIDKQGNVVSGGNLFRKYLLNRCQEEFERGWKTNLPEPKETEGDKKSMEAAMLSDEYYIAAALKRRGLGLVQFIGELYKLGMLTERIMHECVKKLVDYSGVPDEAEIESLSKLLRTIGGNLDATEKGRVMMDVYFARIQSMIDHPELPSRLKFMLMDIIDLRRANWHSKEANKGPKTLEEVRAEAEAAAAAKAAEAARSNTRGGPGRAQLGRGDARGYNSGFPQTAPNQIGMDDLRRLKGGANRTSSSGMTLGPMNSMLNSRSNSGRRLGSAMTRGNEDSAASSRNGTPPVAQKSTNAFEALAGLDTEHPTSPPSTAASPALAKVAPEATTGKESS